MEVIGRFQVRRWKEENMRAPGRSGSLWEDSSLRIPSPSSARSQRERLKTNIEQMCKYGFACGLQAQLNSAP